MRIIMAAGNGILGAGIIRIGDAHASVTITSGIMKHAELRVARALRMSRVKCTETRWRL